jgi:hypothetical protein
MLCDYQVFLSSNDGGMMFSLRHLPAGPKVRQLVLASSTEEDEGISGINRATRRIKNIATRRMKNGFK